MEVLPSHNPRYVAYSYCYKHDDGRTSYPLMFIFFSPLGKLTLCLKVAKNLYINELRWEVTSLREKRREGGGGGGGREREREREREKMKEGVRERESEFCTCHVKRTAHFTVLYLVRLLSQVVRLSFK